VLDFVNRYANGYVALRVALACRNHGLLREHRAADVGALARAYHANEGPLRVALRLLFELGWTDQLDVTRVPYQLPSSVDGVFDIDWPAAFEARDAGAGVSWIQRWLGGWQGTRLKKSF